MSTLLQDVRYGLRMLANNPSFTAVAVVTLALGIGANTAIFSVVYGVLLRPLPYPKPQQIVEIREVSAKGNPMNFTDPNFEDLRSQNRSLQGMAEYAARTQSVSGGSEPTRAVVAAVSSDFFPVMGVQPVLGRGFVAEDQHLGAAPVALISHGLWRQSLGGIADLSKIKLTFGDKSYSIVGVLPAGFRFPSDSDLWVPRELVERLPSRSAHNWSVVARLRDGVPLAQARADLSTIAHRLKQQFGADIDMTDVSVLPLRESLTGSVRSALLILLGAVGFLLLVGCANVANLMLAQAVVRQRELAIRAALGAGRGRLVRQFLAESSLLSFVGSALGVIAAQWGVDALVMLAPRNLPRLGEVSINLAVLFFLLGVSVLVAVGLGVLTAVRATSGDLQAALAEGGRGQGGSLGGQRLGRVIVAGQLAITLVLLVGAGLLGRSLIRVLSIDPGFRTEHIVTMNLALPLAYQERDRAPRARFLDELFARLRTIPGVLEVGGTGRLPLTPMLSDGTYIVMNPQENLARAIQELERTDPQKRPPRLIHELEGLFHDSTRTGYAAYCPVSEGYFRALGIPLVRGRLFDDRDSMDAPHVALISQSVARERWPNQDPLGQTIEFGNMDGDLRLLTIVGIVGDARTDSLETSPSPTIYVNYRQRPQATGRFSVVLRMDGEPARVLPVMREIVRNLDPNVPPSFNTFTKVFSDSLSARRFDLTLVGVFAATALLLAVAGIYGVVAYSVERRTQELGVRMALGACRGDILRLVLGQAMSTAAIGVAAGIGGSFALTRTMQSLLFGTSAIDPITFAGVTLLLSVVALLASYIPARRATKVDPIVALRYE